MTAKDESSLLHSENAPILSTPDTRIFEDVAQITDLPKASNKSQGQLYLTYEIDRTVDEILTGGWKRIALQFPDHMLHDAPWVSQALSQGLRSKSPARPEPAESEQKIFILADTSYGACCVDEVAAEHAAADIVVHYGRTCLSPTSRLPVIYCFTKPELDMKLLINAFKLLYTDKSQNIALMADVPYQDYLPLLSKALISDGYASIFTTTVIRDTASPLPNRTIPPQGMGDSPDLSGWALFHLSEPSPSLLLNIASTVKSIHFYPTNEQTEPTAAIEASTTRTLRRRYALTTSLSTVPIFGILVNTLSVKNYMAILNHVKQLIARAGKKSYTFVVGKVNAAKIANFSEVGGWVVIGCWESSLFESADFWKPLITPFELELALTPDEERVWTGSWQSDFSSLLGRQSAQDTHESATNGAAAALNNQDPAVDEDSADESAPPEFDLRTGRYVSHSRPMGAPSKSSKPIPSDAGLALHAPSTTLTRRPKGDLTTVGGAFSPAADFLRNKRTWQGLGSDFEIAYDDDGAQLPAEGAAVETGRHGIARGYTVGESGDSAGKH